VATVTETLAETSAATQAVATDRSDALVVFGATGDLAYKKIFPALQNMVRGGTLEVPVIGVAKASSTRTQLLDRARASLNDHGGGVDASAIARLADRLTYVDGDYADPTTFRQLRQALGNARRPAHYLAIPPASSAPWSRRLVTRIARRKRAW
jgi:glucose-6-phosphate 1-dehydrogenase